jgi:dTMP kinase
VLVTFSGLDGAGKSSQAEGARAVLGAFGYDVVVEWSRLTFDPGVARIGDPIKRLVASRAKAGPSGVPGHDSGRAMRQRSRVITEVWTTILAVANVVARRRAIMPQLRAGRAVVCDRYVLDAIVQLRLRYGDGRRFPLQEAILRCFSPRPTVAWFLDVPAAVAHARKPDDEELHHAVRQADVYRTEHRRLGVRHLDGTEPPAELCRIVGVALSEEML